MVPNICFTFFSWMTQVPQLSIKRVEINGAAHSNPERRTNFVSVRVHALRLTLLEMKLASFQRKAIFEPMKRPKDGFPSYDWLKKLKPHIFCIGSPLLQKGWSSFFSANHFPERYCSTILLDKKSCCF